MTPLERIAALGRGVIVAVFLASPTLPGIASARPLESIKNRGIRIAFLYLTYYPVTSDSWYMTYVNPVQPSLATGAQNCASPGLYFQVSTDGDITSAMTALFQKAVATARLSQ